MPTAYKNWKRDFIWCVPYTARVGLTGAVSVFIDARWEIPKSYSKTQREGALSGSAYPRADNDNVAKSVMDALTEAGVWLDDNQVVELTVRKRYGESGSIRVRITIAALSD
jgi:Holliday junction resolvase RusA-like endonuclease